jgi:hypothetical protein
MGAFRRSCLSGCTEYMVGTGQYHPSDQRDARRQNVPSANPATSNLQHALADTACYVEVVHRKKA